MGFDTHSVPCENLATSPNRAALNAARTHAAWEGRGHGHKYVVSQIYDLGSVIMGNTPRSIPSCGDGRDCTEAV